MTASPTHEMNSHVESYRHEAFFYASDYEFYDVTADFVRAAIDADQPALIALKSEKIKILRSRLDNQTGHVMFADMEELGRNPARIIPAWREFVDKYAREGTQVRGIGEPIWAERSPAELAESQLHEQLLNVAFESDPPWWLLCPYDVNALPQGVLDEARRSHPHTMERYRHRESDIFGEVDENAAYHQSLPEPTVTWRELTFGDHQLDVIRATVRDFTRSCGLNQGRIDDMVLSVNELATNVLCYSTGLGRLRLWSQDGRAYCEVRSHGSLIHEPLIGRERPSVEHDGGRGLWIVNQLCDLVQIRSISEKLGTVVRVHMKID